jgi:hypothetical protein
VDIVQGLLPQASSLIVGLVTALLTVRLALGRHYREKWWEAKMEAYTSLIEALHHMNRDLELSTASMMRGDSEQSEYEKEWANKHRDAWNEIRRQMDVGEFLYSRDSVEVLRAFNRSTQHDPDDTYGDYLDKAQSAVAKCLPAIKLSAREDLGLPPVR